MIVRVWGIANSQEVEFQPIPERDGYWEGYAPKVPGYQNVEIWAENDKGRRGTLKCTALISYHNDTTVRIVLSPYYASIFEEYSNRIVEEWRMQLV